MLTTTSTSYILLASLDTSRRSLALHGREMAARTIELAQYARDEVNKIEGLYSFGKEILGGEATYSYDPTKLTIHVRHLGITGYETENWCGITTILRWSSVICTIFCASLHRGQSGDHRYFADSAPRAFQSIHACE